MLRSLLVTAGACALLLGAVYLDGPPPAHSGGFGEPTCGQCHFDNPLDAPGGMLALDGIPEAVTPGEVYPLTITLARPEMQRAGFQLSVRYGGGASAGSQAGTLLATDERVAVDRAQGIEYIRHTEAGTALSAPDTVRWRFQWQAPDSAAGAIVFHTAANAANGDESALGDHVYTLEAEIGSGSE